MTHRTSFVALMIAVLLGLLFLVWGVVLILTSDGATIDSAFGLSLLFVASPIVASAVRALYAHHTRNLDAVDHTDQALSLASLLAILVGVWCFIFASAHAILAMDAPALGMGFAPLVVASVSLVMLGLEGMRRLRNV